MKRIALLTAIILAAAMAHAQTGVPTKITAGTNITISPQSPCQENCTINASGGGSGTVSGQANGVIPLATASTTIGAQSHCDDGNTTSGTVTCSEPIATTGGFTATSDGTHAGIDSVVGNTTVPASLPSNSAGWIGPNSASFTSYFEQWPTAGPSTASLICAAAVSSNISAASFCTTITGITIDGVTPTTMGYVDPTSSIQTQLNGKLSSVPTTYTITPCSAQLSNGGSAIAAATYSVIFNGSCLNNFGSTYTIAHASVYSDNSSGSSTCAVTDSASNTVLSASTAANSAWLNNADANISGTHNTVASGVWLNFSIVADGTSKKINCVLTTTR